MPYSPACGGAERPIGVDALPPSYWGEAAGTGREGRGERKFLCRLLLRPTYADCCQIQQPSVMSSRAVQLLLRKMSKANSEIIAEYCQRTPTATCGGLRHTVPSRTLAQHSQVPQRTREWLSQFLK